MKGGITIKEIEKLSASQYRILIKAAEVEQIRERIHLIEDMNAAFNSNNELINSLRKDLREKTSGSIILPLNATPDPNWESKLAKYKR